MQWNPVARCLDLDLRAADPAAEVTDLVVEQRQLHAGHVEADPDEHDQPDDQEEPDHSPSVRGASEHFEPPMGIGWQYEGPRMRTSQGVGRWDARAAAGWALRSGPGRWRWVRILHSSGSCRLRATSSWDSLVTQLADAATFTLGVSRYGIALESNGLAAGIFHAAGLDGVLLAKAVVIVGTIGLLALSSTRFPRLLVWGGAAATAMGLLGFLSNTASILLLS